MPAGHDYAPFCAALVGLVNEPCIQGILGVYGSPMTGRPFRMQMAARLLADRSMKVVAVGHEVG